MELRIDSIGVDAAIEPVGVTADGEMEVPSAEDAGWYRFGPHPGDGGSSVVAAHVDYDRRPGAFFRLREVEIGDRVEVSMSDGSLVVFSVTRLANIAKEELASSGVFDRNGPPRLALITCGGEFDRRERSYRDNVVAIAEPTRG